MNQFTSLWKHPRRPASAVRTAPRTALRPVLMALAAAGAIAALALLAAPTAAGTRTPTANPPTAAAVEVRIKVAPKIAPENARQAAEIFEVLHGGLETADAELRAHLWEVACSLAETGWTAPRIDVAVVSENTIAIVEAPAR